MALQLNSQNFYIKKGYQINPPITFQEKDVFDYWTNERIYLSYLYQYHVYEYAYNIFIKNEYNSVLDIGSGPGIKTNFFFNKIANEIVLIDQPGLEPIISKVFKGSKFIPSNLELFDNDLLSGNKFDLIICADVIEHLWNPDVLLNLIESSIKVGGKAIISTPERDIIRGEKCMQCPNKSHVREWNKSEFNHLINSKKFVINRHFLLPQKKLNWFNWSLRAQIGKLIKWKEKSLYGNQVIDISLNY